MNAVSGGIRGGLVAAFGCTLGIVPHMVAAISGTAALFHASDVAFEVLKFAGVGYRMNSAFSSAPLAQAVTFKSRRPTPGPARRRCPNAAFCSLRRARPCT